MLTSAATITGTETSRPGLRARVRRVSRSARLAVLLGLAAGATLVTTALPASAATSSHAFNLTGPWQTVAGTNCSVLVGTDMNSPNAWPGTATQVSCPSRHKTTSCTPYSSSRTRGAGGTGRLRRTPTPTPSGLARSIMTSRRRRTASVTRGGWSTHTYTWTASTAGLTPTTAASRRSGTHAPPTASADASRHPLADRQAGGAASFWQPARVPAVGRSNRVWNVG
jgi:hypothetical protein